MDRYGALRTVLGGVLAWLAVPITTVAAQDGAWQVTATAAQSWFSGGLDDTTTTDGNYTLAPRIAWGLTADRALGKVRLGLGVSYVSSHVQVSNDQVTIVEGTLDVSRVGVAALVTVPLARLGSAGGAVSLAAGPALGIWSLTDQDTRTRFGGIATLQVAAPLTPSWQLLASIGETVSGSPFNADDLPGFFEATTLWATAVGLGVRYAF